MRALADTSEKSACMFAPSWLSQALVCLLALIVWTFERGRLANEADAKVLEAS